MGIICLFITLIGSLQAEKDYPEKWALERLYNDKLYYNVIAVNDKIYIGSSDGVFEFKEDLKKINSNPGYVSFNAIENSFENLSFIEGLLDEKYKSFVINSQKKEGFALELKNKILIVNDNYLYIYRKEPYSKILNGKSIRSISKNYIGSYSGIYDFNQNRTFDLEYTNGKIREFDNTSFICYDGLLKITPRDTLNFINPLNINTFIEEENIGFSRDIMEANNGNFILTTSKGLYLLSNKMKILNRLSAKTAPLLVFKQYFSKSQNIQRMFMVLGNKLLWLDPESLKISTIEDLKFNPTDCVFDPKRDTVYLSSNDGVYSFNVKSSKLSFLSTGEFHSIVIFDDHIALTNNQSLSVYDLNNNVMYNNLISDEFNKGALFVNDNEQLLIGSTSGLYVLNNIFELTSYRQGSNNLTVILIVLLIIVTGILSFNSSTKKERNFYSINEKAITVFIEQNLASVDVLMISEYFKVSKKTIYNNLKPKKPGEIIRVKRIKKAIDLKEKGVGFDQISKVTGLSKNYLKNNFMRLKNSLN